MNSGLNLLYRCNRFCGGIHYEEALYQVYAPFTFTFTMKNRLRAFRDSALVNFDEWFSDRLSGCSIALSLIK